MHLKTKQHTESFENTTHKTHTHTLRNSPNIKPNKHNSRLLNNAALWLSQGVCIHTHTLSLRVCLYTHTHTHTHTHTLSQGVFIHTHTHSVCVYTHTHTLSGCDYTHSHTPPSGTVMAGCFCKHFRRIHGS